MIRLGKFDSSRTDHRRPVRVTLQSDGLVAGILKKGHLLKGSATFSKIFISQDRTPMQLELYRNARAELGRRRANGETGIRIKYVKGIPEIVQSEN